MAIETSKVGAAVRDQFPIFEHTTYLNSCSQGALSRRVRAAYEEMPNDADGGLVFDEPVGISWEG